MSNLTVAYINLSVGLCNPFGKMTHKALIGGLRDHFLDWKGFFAKYDDYSLGFIICTNRDIKVLEVKGPSISRKMKVVDFSIFLPEEVEKLNPSNAEDIGRYLDWVFLAIATALIKYEVSGEEIKKIKDEVKRELNVI
jgi:hypothetical protein